MPNELTPAERAVTEALADTSPGGVWAGTIEQPRAVVAAVRQPLFQEAAELVIADCTCSGGEVYESCCRTSCFDVRDLLKRAAELEEGR